MSLFARYCLVLSTLSLSVVIPAHGEETASPASDAALITATRFATSIDTAPVNVTVITSVEISNSNATNIAEALEFLGNANTRDMFGIGGTKTGVDLSGFGATGSLNTLILLNGRRLNEIDLSEVNLSAIPLKSVARIEIVRGSNTVLYGDNAAGGVINIVTKTGFDSPAASVTLGAGSYGMRQLAASTRYANEQHAFYAAGSGATSDGYRDNGATTSSNLFAEYTHQSDAATAGVRVSLNRDNPELPGSLNEPAYKADPQSAGNTVGELTETQHSAEVFFGGAQLAGELAYRAKTLDGQSSSTYGDYSTEAEQRTFSLTPRLRGTTEGNDWIVGIDAYHSTLESTALWKDATDPTFDTHYAGDITHNSYAVYATDTYALFERLSINFGARYQQVQLKTRSDDLLYSTTLKDDTTDHATAWDATLRFHYSPGANGYFRHAQSFRFPVLDEVWSYFTGTISKIEPQTGNHTEAGLIAPLTPDTRIEFQVFHIALENEIAYRNDLFANVNLDPTQHDGVNFSIQSQVEPAWKVRFDYAYRDAAFRSGPDKDKSIPEIPADKFVLSNAFDFTPEHRFVLDVIYTGRRYFGDDFTNAGKRMPDYTWLNVGYHYTQTSWKAAVVVKNLANESASNLGLYRGAQPDPYYYFPLPERSLAVTLDASF